MKKTLPAFFLLILVSGVAADCEIIEASQASIDGEEILPGDIIDEEAEVEVQEGGEILAMCGSTYVEASQGTGTLEEIGESEEFSHDLDGDLGSLLEEAEVEENLDEVNQVMDEEVPDRVQSLILGDDVNVHLGETVVGLESEDSEITSVEEGGVESPDLEIKMREETVQDILTAENSMEQLQDAYGDEIEVEAHSWKYRVMFGAVNVASSVHGFVSNLI